MDPFTLSETATCPGCQQTVTIITKDGTRQYGGHQVAGTGTATCSKSNQPL